jgi:hypothetical protein
MLRKSKMKRRNTEPSLTSSEKSISEKSEKSEKISAEKSSISEKNDE